MTPLAKGCSSIVLLVALAAALFIFGLRSCLSKYDERTALPPALYFKKDNGAVLLSLVKYSKATSYSQSGGFIRKTVSNSYYIQSNDAISGNKIASKEIGDDIKHFPEKILGSDGRHAWVFLDELLAFDAFTLQKVADIEIIEARNPSLAGIMPLESSYYHFDGDKQAVIFTSSDGARWQLDSKTLIAKTYEVPAKEDEWNNKNRAAKELRDRIKQLQQLNLHFNQLKINQDTVNGTWWGVYSKEEMADISTNISFTPAYKQDQRRQLFTGKYDSTSPGYFSFREPLALNAGKAVYYLDAGFLADKETAKPIKLISPESYLLVYKTVIGEAGEIMIGRINTGGSMLWHLNTGLKKWIDYMQKDNRLYIFGSDNKEISSSECNLLLIVDLDTGRVRKYDYFEDEVRK